MTAREIVKKRLNHEHTDSTPYDVQFEPELYRRLCEHYGDDDWQSKKLRSFSCSYLTVDTVGMKEIDAIWSKDAYGALWRMDRKPWSLVEPPLPGQTLEGYTFPTAESFVSPILRDKPAAIAAYEADDEHYRIINMGWGIFEHSWRLRGFVNALMDMATDEDFYIEMTTRITDLYIAMLKACEDVPADAYLFGDDWGEQRGLIMGPDRWRRLLKPCWARIYAEVHRQGKISIQHSCGSVVDIYGDLHEIGMDAHESVQPEARGMEPSAIKARWGNRISFWGCLGSQGILYHGSPKEIQEEIYRLRNLFHENGGHVLAPAKPLPDEMPLEKALAVVETLSTLNPA